MFLKELLYDTNIIGIFALTSPCFVENNNFFLNLILTYREYKSILYRYRLLYTDSILKLIYFNFKNK